MTDDEALQAALQAEHAAIYGYGVLGARLDTVTRRAAQAAFDAHRALRDSLAARLRERGVMPATPLAAYDVTVADPAAALLLAVHLEQAVAVRWRDLVASTGDSRLRVLAVDALRGAAVRAAQWRQRAGVRPATVALPGS